MNINKINNGMSGDGRIMNEVSVPTNEQKRIWKEFFKLPGEERITVANMPYEEMMKILEKNYKKTLENETIIDKFKRYFNLDIE